MVAQRSQSDDGRVARRLENRVRIVDALFELIRAGQYHPTLKDIAEKAGVTPRTLLNHFPDVGALLQAALVRGRELADQDLPELPSGSDPEARVRAFFVNCAAFYDAYAAIRWSTLTYKGNLQGFEPNKSRSQVLHRVEGRVIALVEEFGVSVEQDRELRRALRMVSDPLSWRLLRVQQKLSRAEAAASLARSVIALARDAQRTTTTTTTRTLSKRAVPRASDDLKRAVPRASEDLKRAVPRASDDKSSSAAARPPTR